MTEPYNLARANVDRLLESWTWLALLVVPGPEARIHRPYDDGQAEALSAQGMAARTYRHINLKAGLSALAPAKVPVRLDIVDAQAVIHRIVLQLVRRVASAGGASYVGGRAGQVAAVVDALGYLDSGPPWAAIAVDGDGTAWRQGGRLDEIRDDRLLQHIAEQLRHADEIARTAARATDETVRQLEHRCPACGNRSLQMHHDGRDQRQWHVRCVSELCVCTGVGCGCLQAYRQAGRHHAWSRAELGGSYGLATAIAMAASRSRRARGRLRSSTVGHGDWAERRTENVR